MLPRGARVLVMPPARPGLRGPAKKRGMLQLDVGRLRLQGCCQASSGRPEDRSRAAPPAILADGAPYPKFIGEA